jgi:hypothetical protein
MGDIKSFVVRTRDIKALDRIDAFAKANGRSRNDAIMALAIRALDDLSATQKPQRSLSGAEERAIVRAHRKGVRVVATMSAPLDEPGRHTSIVSGLNLQVGPTPRRGPLLKKAAK